jgi:hypothetical protein
MKIISEQSTSAFLFIGILHSVITSEKSIFIRLLFKFLLAPIFVA